MQINAEVRGCPGTSTIDSQADIVGSYREDGRLVFTKFWSPQSRHPLTVRCGTVSGTGQLPWGGDWLGYQDEVAVPLEDGVHVSRGSLFNPVYVPIGEGEGTLELEYGRRPTPVAAAPRR